MNRLSFLKKVLIPAIILLISTIFYGCGGGGGGDGGGGTVDGFLGITYTGATTQATIDENNAFDIVVGAYEAGNNGQNLNIFGAIEANNTTKGLDLLSLADFFILTSNEIKSPLQNAEYIGAVISDNAIIAGSCGGSASMSIKGDDQTGSFNGSMQFNNFCEPDFTANGSATFSGSINLQTEEPRNIALSFNNLRMSSGGESLGLNGSVKIDFISSPMQMTMSFVIMDYNVDKSYKLQNFVFKFTDGFNFVEVTASGRYFHYDYGYIDISTEAPLRIYDYDYSPSSGILIFTGREGAEGGNTKARFIVIDSSYFVVDADTDGDGFYDDYNSGSIPWTNI